MPKDKKRYKIKDKPQTAQNNPEKDGFFGSRQRRERTPDELREHLKLFLFLITWIIFLSGVYMVCMRIEFEFIMPVYLILGTVFFFTWLICNGGFKKFDVGSIEKPEETSYEEFTAFINKLRERQRKAKYFLALSIPFPVIMLVDYTIIVWGERFAG